MKTPHRFTTGLVNYFVEVDYSYASFPTIKWARETGWQNGAPRGINLGNVNLSFGLQLTVKEKK